MKILTRLEGGIFNKHMEIRLQKYIADCGICSRRKAEELILAGKVQVNSEIVTELGTKVNEHDKIEVEGKAISQSTKKVYILLNKPVGYVTTAGDEHGRPTVLDLIAGEIAERLFPVGRLDINTSGALILTNDGDFAYKLTHPKHELGKTYEVILNKTITDAEIKKIEAGVEIPMASPVKGRWHAEGMTEGFNFESGGVFHTSPCIIRQITSTSLHITIHEGKNRQIRKMFTAAGKKVLELKRIKIGRLALGNLPLGRWRHLSQAEIDSIQK